MRRRSGKARRPGRKHKEDMEYCPAGDVESAILPPTVAAERGRHYRAGTALGLDFAATSAAHFRFSGEPSAKPATAQSRR